MRDDESDHVKSQNIENNQPWHSLSHEMVLNVLNTSHTAGLSQEEVEQRRKVYGLNQLLEKPPVTFLERLLQQLSSFLVILLIVAAIISFVLGDTVESAAIMAIVVLNAILGVVQEGRAEQALEALKKLSAPDAQVLRGGSRQIVPSPQLVPGDIVFLEAGYFIPADLRLLQTVNLKVQEASLTGEAHDVEKEADSILKGKSSLGDRYNCAFMGTTVTYGRGTGVVVSTGMNTELGKIAGILQSVKEEDTPLQKNLDKLGKQLGMAALFIVALVFIMGVLRLFFDNGGIEYVTRSSEGLEAIKETFMIAVSLAIAAVPEGLAAVVTISLAMGMREMVKRKALIRRLASVETLGSATIICSDKTGTLTQNVMTVTQLWVDQRTVDVSGSGYDPEGKFMLDGDQIDLSNYPGVRTAIWIGAMNNDAQLEVTTDETGQNNYRMIGDATEGSLLVAAIKAGCVLENLKQAYPRKQEIPFDSVRKRMITIHNIVDPRPEDMSPMQDRQKKNWHVFALKGAPDIMLNLCDYYQTIDNQVRPMDGQVREKIRSANDDMTKQALRVLGVAYRLTPKIPDKIIAEEVEKELIFAGLIGMIDPARQEVGDALEEAKQAGIRTVMITGDYSNTAQAIAESIGLLRPGHGVLTGSQLDEIDDTALVGEVERTDVFARVSPEHKMRIVDALKMNQEVVAMTGDGVNDAPAIKRADIGVSMGITGTDVAKETADMVLMDDNYATIVSAIEQGRVIYSNIRKFVYYLISCNLAEIAIIFLATLFGLPSPLTALQLLWLNLLTDGAPALALATEKGDPDIMKQPPRPPDEPIINRSMRSGIVVQTFAITAVTLAAFFIGLSDTTHQHYAQTMAFVTLSSSELFRAYTARSEFYPLFKVGVLSNKWMNYAVLVSLILILLVVYAPLPGNPFQTEPLGWLQWLEIIPLFLIPSIAAELSKQFMMRRKK